MNEYKKLEIYYGDKWYYYFFNYYHLTNTINIINETSSQKNELKEKFGTEWYNKHISNYFPVQKKLIYSYEGIIKNEFEKKLAKKEKGHSAIIDKNEDFNEFKTSKQIDIYKICQYY